MGVSQYFAVLMVDKDVAGPAVFDVGDLKAIRVPDLLRLECCVDAVHLHCRFGLLGLQEEREVNDG